MTEDTKIDVQTSFCGRFIFEQQLAERGSGTVLAPGFPLTTLHVLLARGTARFDTA